MQRNDLSERLPDNAQVRLLFDGRPFRVFNRQDVTQEKIINAIMQAYEKKLRDSGKALERANRELQEIEDTLRDEMFSPARRRMQPFVVQKDDQSLQADRISININFPPSKIAVFEYGFTLKQGDNIIGNCKDTVETIYELSRDKKSWHLKSMQTTGEVVQQFKSNRNRARVYGVLGVVCSLGSLTSFASLPFLLTILTPAIVFPVLLPLALVLIIAGPLLGALAHDIVKNNRKPLLESLPPPPPAPPSTNSYGQIRRQSGMVIQPEQTSTLPSAPLLSSEKKPASPDSPAAASKNHQHQSPRVRK